MPFAHEFFVQIMHMSARPRATQTADEKRLSSDEAKTSKKQPSPQAIVKSAAHVRNTWETPNVVHPFMKKEWFGKGCSCDGQIVRRVRLLQETRWSR